MSTPGFALEVLVTIKPLHSLVQNIMGDTGEATLLIENASPHGFQLKPSSLKAINAAEVVYYIDDSLETYIKRIASTTNDTSKFIAVAKHLGLGLTEMGDNNHKHAHDHHDHAHDEFNAHIWLSPDYAGQTLDFIAQHLSEKNPAQSSNYKRNLARAKQRLSLTIDKLKTELEPVSQQAYLVKHNAFQYFEQQFQLNNIGAIQLDPSIPPSLKFINDVKALIRKHNVECIFGEPQFQDKIVPRIAQAAAIKSATLDPLGSNLPPGSDLYFHLLENLAHNLTECLQP